jgi:predicted alpha/beta hydrolase family esterase
MDMKEASAMTEASGLTNEQHAIEQSSDARRLPLQSPSQDVAIVWAERLRKVTMKAPLQSLFVAFLLGVWVARRR